MPNSPSVNRRSEKAHAAILDATLRILSTQGYVDLTVERIAKEAGVGKQTIYRWWTGKADLVLEVWQHRLLPTLEPYDGVTAIKTYLEQSLVRFGEQLARTECRQAAICLLAEAHRNPELHRLMDESVYQPRIALIKDALHRAEPQELLAPATSVDTVIDTLYGAIWYKVLIRFEDVPRQYVAEIIEQAFK
ncbi:MAG: TetR/AcrR family transcriptional regulator [Pseudomonadales bacterium]